VPTPSDEAIEREEDEALQRALSRLPEDYRRVILLRHHEGRSLEEIGQLMQRSAEAVRKLWARAIERLQDEIEIGPSDPLP
jgi:RNA polymerase sigma-70 factor (ECF subfamily)